VDSYRYYFLREIQFGRDGAFSWESMVERHNADLANGLGNLASRVLAMLATSFGGVIPEPTVEGAEADLPDAIEDAARRYEAHMEALALGQALGAVWGVVDRANGYLVQKEPWKLAKDEGARDELAAILYAAAETLRILAVLVAPAMPGAARRRWEQLGVEDPLESQRLPEAARWGQLRPGTGTAKGEALFPRLEL
jgi:methionyl-tRNA synthetase